jgi:cobalt/nickel transport system permease protein
LSSQPIRQPRSAGNGFIERTLLAINRTLDQSLYAGQIAGRDGLLQSLDARIKIVLTLLFLVAVSLARNPWALVALNLLALTLAGLSKIPPGYLLKRVWLPVLIFSGLVSLPALFLTPGPAWLALPFGLVVTRTGGGAALFLMLRAGASVAFAVLLLLSTPWNRALQALSVLHVPDVILVILGMTYRYLYLFLHLAEEMFLSRRSRLLRKASGAEARQILAASGGVLLTRSLQMSEQVYLAMQARGFRGSPRTQEPFRIRTRDWLVAALLACAAAATLWIGR